MRARLERDLRLRLREAEASPTLIWAPGERSRARACACLAGWRQSESSWSFWPANCLLNRMLEQEFGFAAT